MIDAAVRLGNELGLPVLVYHGLREDYPFASDRLHRLILGASRDVAIGCQQRGLACVQYVDRAEKREKGLVYRLAAGAAQRERDIAILMIPSPQAPSRAAGSFFGQVQTLRLTRRFVRVGSGPESLWLS